MRPWCSALNSLLCCVIVWTCLLKEKLSQSDAVMSCLLSMEDDEKRNLKGIILSHVDDFILAGNDNFMKEIMDKIKKKLDISKLEDD